YLNEGYILAQVLAFADADRGTVEIQVLEGYVADVVFSGETRGRRRLLESISTELEVNRPLRSDVLERYLLLLNDLPGVSATATPVASEDEIGGATLYIALEHDPTDFFVGYRNRASEILGTNQIDVEAA